MAKIAAFQGIHYNPEIVDDIAKVVCPPYDIIDSREQEELYQRHPYNMVRLILGKDLAGDNEKENKYTRAASYIEEWLRRTILVKDPEPSIYFYEQFFGVDAREYSRLGVVGLLKLEDEEGAGVHPHEHTHAAPKEDRYRLMSAVEANLDPIFTIYSDPEKQLRSLFDVSVRPAAPLFDVTDSRGLRQRVWRVSGREVIEKARALLADREIFIADGHHRYEVARRFRNERRSEDPSRFKDAYNYLLTYFTPLEDEGLCILATHRLVKNSLFSMSQLEACFSVKECGSPADLSLEMAQRRQEVGIFGLYKEGRSFLLRTSDKRECNRSIQEGPKEYKNLDVVILHKVIFENLLKIPLAAIAYEVNLEAAVRCVDNREADALFLLNPTRVEQIRSIALAGEVMPQKSTYFYPKLTSGFFVNKF